MNGVDVADQLIANYRPKLKCRRTWMPIMFHSFDILRINMFIIHYRISQKKVKSTTTHKKFSMDLVTVLRNRAREVQAMRKMRGQGMRAATTRAVTTSAAVVSPLAYDSIKKRKSTITEKRRFSSTDPGRSLDE